MAGKDALLIGIDVGTEGVKTVALDQKGELIGSAQVSYTFEVPQPGWTEQDPEVWWEAVKKSFGLLAEKGIDLQRVISIGVTGQMHSAVLLSESGEVVRKAILWNDQRTNEECEEIKERIGMDDLMSITCNTVMPGFTAPKLLWIRKHEPEIYARIAHVLMPKDYIRYRLTDVLAADVTDASGTALFDVEERCWANPIIGRLGLPPAWFPPVYESSQIVSAISKEAAEESGIPEGVPVVAGAGDNAAAAVGNGIYRAGQGMISVGTSGVAFVPLKKLPSVQDRKQGNPTVHLFCHAIPNTWHAMGVTLAAGGSLRWFREAFAPGADYSALVQPVETVEPGSDGLLFLPYLTGERTPHDDANARGVFFGINLRHRREHFTRAILEGVSYSVLDCLQLLETKTKEVPSFVLTGGIVNSGIWSQILSDVSGKELQIAAMFEGPAIGAAVLAGIGIGTWKTPQDAVRGQSAQSRRIAPDEKKQAMYQTYFQKYQSLYRTAKELFY
ncbi:xylulokinase [Aneurinibacillus terranovensis]|uniref:xylulokinase n=1 Tax=Aneurinibacillus terranovensis TaxID=278991 RepID=UPI0003FCAF0E|nr:xylulokinase [Aneurinibacillus terranovensis]